MATAGAAISAVLAPAVTLPSSLGIYTLFNLSHERIPKQPDPNSPSASARRDPAAAPGPSLPRPPAAAATTSGVNSVTTSKTGGPALSSAPPPRHYPSTADFSLSLSHDPILEEQGDESDESDAPVEPVTPVSGRHSQDFHTLHSHDSGGSHHHRDSNSSSLAASVADGSTAPKFAPLPPVPSTPKTAPAQAPAQAQTLVVDPPPATATATPAASLFRATTSPGRATADDEADAPPVPLSRRSTRGQTIRRTMSSFFRRSNSQSDKAAFGLTPAAPPAPPTVAASESNLADARTSQAVGRALRKSATTTQSNTPPSPGSPPLEMALSTKSQVATPQVPSAEDFLTNNKKKARASTGLSLHRAIHFVSNARGGGGGGDSKKPRPERRRASSFDHSKEPAVNRGEPWALPAEAGTGLKARRMSLSLPDDFTVDVGDLHLEYEYQHKMGRHRKHLGKGATSKVTLMFRKGCPDELYAVKEFRGKSSSETKEEYEKKVKSEYSIAKSLHHPNLVETIRLCDDHGRWNHVMEYCQEGDLFSLVEKKYLTRDDREKDRQCLFKQLIQGLNYLHNHGIAHRDIKLENLLITSHSKLKITDFGVSEVFSGIHPGLREAGGQCGMNVDDEVRLCTPGICGSLPYISPEVLQGKESYDPRKLDVWGAAVVMLNLIFGAPLWKEAKVAADGGQYVSLVKGWDRWNARHNEDDDISDNDYPKVPAFDFAVNPPVLRRILLQMLNPDPKKRATIAKVAGLRWMKGVECCQLESYEDPTRLIDASKKNCTKLLNGQKIFCHDHLPPRSHGSHSLGKMPGSAGY